MTPFNNSYLVRPTKYEGNATLYSRKSNSIFNTNPQNYRNRLTNYWHLIFLSTYSPSLQKYIPTPSHPSTHKAWLTHTIPNTSDQQQNPHPTIGARCCCFMQIMWPKMRKVFLSCDFWLFSQSLLLILPNLIAKH